MAVSPSDRRPDGAWGKPTLRQLLGRPDQFVVVSELVTSRGLITEARAQGILSLARELTEHPRVDALSITDNPGGHAMLAADTLGTDLIQRGQEVIIHLACKDWNRNALESRGWKLGSEGFHNVLALSGDYPMSGYKGVAAPVFDIDSVGLLRMFSDMNEGRGDGSTGATDFFLGCVVTNHKRYEREVVPQYLKLRKKVENGARFVINQIGYDARKDDELVRWMALDGLDVPVLANVYVLTPRAARVFNSGRIPGVVVTDELLALVENRDRSFFLDLAAKQVAIARGIGCRGIYLGGQPSLEEFDAILTAADAFAPEDWRSFAKEIQFAQPNEFYWFERDPETGLSATDQPALRSKGHAPLRYRFSRRLHALVFGRQAPLFDAGRALYSAVDQGPAPVRKSLHLVEQGVKVPLFGCKDCGDCSLPDVAYLCPESQCVKNQRNGPCGGTREGKCEVGEKDCIWALAYDRLKVFGEEAAMLDGPAVIKDNSLRGTSAWANTFLGRDHQAKEN